MMIKMCDKWLTTENWFLISFYGSKEISDLLMKWSGDRWDGMHSPLIAPCPSLRTERFIDNRLIAPILSIVKLDSPQKSIHPTQKVIKTLFHSRAMQNIYHSSVITVLDSSSTNAPEIDIPSCIQGTDVTGVHIVRLHSQEGKYS